MRESFGLLRAEDTTEERNMLEILIFLKETRDSTIKARGYADRHKQCEKYNDTDTTSPLVSMEAVLISTVINAFEEQ